MNQPQTFQIHSLHCNLAFPTVGFIISSLHPLLEHVLFGFFAVLHLVLHGGTNFYCTTFGLDPTCTNIFLLSPTFLLTILAIFYPSTGVLSSPTKGREPRSCQSWFVVASRPPLDPFLVQAMTRACPGHAISPIPCLPTEDVLPPPASFLLLHLMPSARSHSIHVSCRAPFFTTYYYT
jgi:hypothetical protein